MYLIDTHVIIWILYKPEELPARVRNILDNEQCYYSVVSLWEMAIKAGLKKISLNQTIEQISNSLERSGIARRDITPYDCDVVMDLPPIHKDPFDRMIVSQAMTGSLTIVTKDSTIPQYDIAAVWD